MIIILASTVVAIPLWQIVSELSKMNKKNNL